MTVATVEHDALGMGMDVATWSATLEFAVRMAEYVNRTEFVPSALRGRPEAVAATIMYGAEVGLTPMQALAGIHIIEGRPSPSSETMRALIYRAGHNITFHEASGTRVRVSGLRAGQPESQRYYVDWSLDMARSAGLLGRKNWQNYPRAMLMARATGDLARAMFPDVVKGLGYVAEDLEVDGAAPEVIGQDAPRKAIQRTRKPKAAPAATPEPDDAPTPPSEPTAHTEAPPPVAPVPTPREVVSEPNDAEPAEVTLPELEPEQAPDEPPVAPPNVLGPGLLRAVHRDLGKALGTVASREEKLAMLSAILNRPVLSSKTLTRGEGLEVVDVLGQIESGVVTYDMDPEYGGITINRPAEQ